MAEPKLNYERVMAYRPSDIRVSYGERECILYALGIGAGMDPLDPGELKFVYERAGLAAEMPIAQMWRDARSFMITEGPVEVMRMVLAREIFRGQA